MLIAGVAAGASVLLARWMAGKTPDRTRRTFEERCDAASRELHRRIALRDGAGDRLAA